MLSLPKILLTGLIILAVIFASRALTKRGDRIVEKAEAKRKEPRQGWRERSRERKRQKKREPQAVDLEKCAVCGEYTGPDSSPCERADCPLSG